MSLPELLFLQIPPPRFAFHLSPSNIPLAGGFLAGALFHGGLEVPKTAVLQHEASDVLADQAMIQSIVALGPDVLALSLYVWNVQRSLYLASRVKEQLPGIRILIGGPEVSPGNEWVLRHPAVDAGVFGEGEGRITPVVKALLYEKLPAAIPGTFRKFRGGLFVFPGSADPWELGSCRYPYLAGFIEPSRDGTVFLETVRGCPFRCRYCYYHKSFKGVRRYTGRAVEEMLDFIYAPHSGVQECYLMDPTFNAVRGYRELLRSIAARRWGPLPKLHTELRADLVTPRDIELFAEAGLTSVEVGLQTINPEALRMAGRQGKPASVARGVRLLKGAGIEVTTGIILGLPGDTPDWLHKTVQWLKQEDAYSVVNPFMLSLLPGTELRAEAGRLGLDYDPRPPYYVRSTPSFPAESFCEALETCEEIFEMEIDYIAVPRLIDRGPSVVDDPAAVPYVSTWIVRPTDRQAAGLLPLVARRATDPFTFWFRGQGGGRIEDAVVAILGAFARYNPHTVMHVVFELPEPPTAHLFQSILDVAGDPELTLNRTYWPLHDDGELVTPVFTVILPHPEDPGVRERMRTACEPFATVVWDRGTWKGQDAEVAELPLLISWAREDAPDAWGAILKEGLERRYADRADEVLFREPLFQEAWDRLTGKRVLGGCFADRILVTAPGT